MSMAQSSESPAITETNPGTMATVIVSFAVGLVTVTWATPAATALIHPESLMVAMAELPVCHEAEAGGVLVPVTATESRKESPTASDRRAGEIVSPPGGVTTTGFSRSVQ